MLAVGWGVGTGIGWGTEFFRQLCIALGRALARYRGDLRGKQIHNDAILIGSPHGAIEAQEGSTGRFFATKPNGAFNQPRHKPLEADGNLHQLPVKAFHHAVNHGGGHQSLSHTGIPPLRTVTKEVLNSHGKVMIGVHQARIGSDNAMAIRIGVVAGGKVEA